MSAIILDRKEADELLAIQGLRAKIANNKAPTLDFSQKQILSSSTPPDGHIAPISVLTALPSGRLASGSEDNTIKLWDLTSNTCVAALSGHTRSVSALTVLSDGLRLASGSYDRTIKLWSLTSNTCVATLSGHTAAICALAGLPHGRLASGSIDGTIRLWNPARWFGKCVSTLNDTVSTRWFGNCLARFGGYTPRALTVLPNGWLASGLDGETITLWDPARWFDKRLVTLSGHTRSVSALTTLPDGRLASGSMDNTIKLWDLTSNTCVATLSGHTEGVKILTTLPDGRLASGSDGHTIKLWDLTSNACIATLSEHDFAISALAVLPNGQLVGGSRSGAIKIWDNLIPRLLSPQEMTVLLEALTTNRSVIQLNLQNARLDDRAIVLLQKLFNSHPVLQLCDLRDTTLSSTHINRLYQAFKTRDAGLSRLQLLHEGLAKFDAKERAEQYSSSREASAFEAKTAKESFHGTSGTVEPSLLRILAGHTSPVSALTVLADGRLASGSRDRIKLWDLTSNTCVATLREYDSNISVLATLPNGRLASGGDSKDKIIKLWDLISNTCVATLQGHTAPIRALTALPDGRLASSSEDNTIKFWDLTSNACVATLHGHTAPIRALAVLPNGRLASSSEDSTIKLWSLTSSICVATLSGHTQWVSALTVLPNGWLASGSDDRTIKLWDLTSNTCVATLNGHLSVSALTALSTGRLVSGSYGGAIKLWDLTSNACIATFSRHILPTQALIALPNGQLASGSFDNTIKLWDLITPQPRLAAVQPFSLIPPMQTVAPIYVPSKKPTPIVTRLAPFVPLAIATVSPTPSITVASAPVLSTISPPTALTAPHIPWREISLDEMIGNGSYGDVYKGQWQGTTVAVKQLQLKTLSAPLAKEFEHETNMMMRCHFPCVVRLYGVCTEPGHVAMVMEYLPMSLRQRLQEARELKWDKRLSIALNIAQGLTSLHNRYIVHRDLKSLNILLTEQEQAKIADFGLAKVKLEVSSTSTKTHKSGSVRWRAPELFKPHSSPSSITDIYSLGLVLWELASRDLPFKNAADDATVISWIKDGAQEIIPNNCPKAFAEIIQNCWAAPALRPTAAGVVAQLQVAIKEIQEATLREEQELKTSSERVWHFDASLKPLPHQMTSGYALIPADEKDIEKVNQAYAHGPVQGYDIRSVQIIYNPTLNRSFSLRLKLLQEQSAAAFTPRWEEENNPELRDKINTLFETMTKGYTDPDFPDLKLLPVWHGTRTDILPSLFNTGFVNLASTDAGYFGKGIYGSYEADYAYQVYFRGALLMNWAACRSAYPVIDGDMSKLTGKANYQNYDAHLVPVVPEHPLHDDSASYIPCKPGQIPRYTEMVVFDRTQCLPRYLVELQPSLPKAPSAQPVASLLYAFLGTAAPAKVEKKAAKVAAKVAS
jgi:WD40 repeat protein/serine/threonine protein kinase